MDVVALFENPVHILTDYQGLQILCFNMFDLFWKMGVPIDKIGQTAFTNLQQNGKNIPGNLVQDFYSKWVEGYKPEEGVL